jgi:inhibitor of cysteine peptidase
MSRNTGLHRLLIGVALMGSVMLSACGARMPVDGAQSEEPVVIETPDVVGGNVFIDSVDVLILESFPVQVQAVVQGNLPDGCTDIEEVRVDHEEGSNLFEITVVTHRDPELMCTMALVPFEENVSLDVLGLSAGTYTVDAHGVTGTFELAVDNVLETD